MTNALLSSAGDLITYQYQAGRLISPTMFKGPEKTVMVEKGGLIVEIINTDFVGNEADFPQDPQRGDKITIGSQKFEVRPIGEKCFHRTLGMIRIHTQQVHA
jgi:hypothetical protein